MKIHAFLFFFLVSFQLRSQETALPADVTESIQTRIEYGMNPSIVVGVIDKNGTHYFAYGAKTIGGEAVNEHTLYEIGSITKVFTATLLANNIVKGDMNADDPAGKYLPSSVTVPAYDGISITLGHLSDHTSALPRLPVNMNPADPADPYADYTPELLYSFLNSYTLEHAPGSQFEYSNLAVGMLGHILALHSGKSYESLVKKTITSPLKMKETFITLDEKKKENLAIGHSMGIEVSNWDFSALAGAGAIRSSAFDMLKFLSAQLGLSKTSLKEAMSLTHQTRHDRASDAKVGLGWLIKPGSEGDIYWHNGGTGGYRSFAGFVKETGKGVVVLTNSGEGTDDIGLHLLDPESKLRAIKPPLVMVLKQVIDDEGPEGLVEKYQAITEFEPDKYDVDEMAINSLGYNYMGQNRLDAALALFEINVIAFPGSSNVYDSYGEALMKTGQTQEAIVNYKKSLELNPGNTNAVEMLGKMGVAMEPAEVEVSEAILESYTGIYELFPGFNIEITRQGKQLFGQATGQPRFELFAKTPTEFYLKVVDAQIHFSISAADVVTMTLYQNGQVMPGRRI